MSRMGKEGPEEVVNRVPSNQRVLFNLPRIHFLEINDQSW